MDKSKKGKFLEGVQKVIVRIKRPKVGFPKSEKAIDFKQAFKEETRNWRLADRGKTKARTKKDKERVDDE